jgi:regulator of sirC expression with transglutaminase-like and TPR domain
METVEPPMTDPLTDLGLVEESEIELDKAALQLAALDHPGTELAPYLDLLDEIAGRLGARAPAAATPRARAAALAQVLAGDYGFEGDRESYDDPANADLIRVLDRRRGLPVALAILYSAMGRRLGWAVNALNTPAHVLASVGAARPVVIDPFDRGALVQVQQLTRLLEAAGAGSPREVEAMPNRAVLVRLLMNQATRAEQAGARRRALTLFERITTFGPGYSFAWWERARLERALGDDAAARRSLVSMLETTRDPQVRRQVRRALEALGG